MREEIDSRLGKVQEIRFEPRLLEEEDDRLKQGSQISQSRYQLILLTLLQLRCQYCIDVDVIIVTQMCLCFKGCYNYLYRMKALDAIRDSGGIKCNAQT